MFMWLLWQRVAHALVLPHFISSETCYNLPPLPPLAPSPAYRLLPKVYAVGDHALGNNATLGSYNKYNISCLKKSAFCDTQYVSKLHSQEVLHHQRVVYRTTLMSIEKY
jgi:hypothetical protein